MQFSWQKTATAVVFGLSVAMAAPAWATVTKLPVREFFKNPEKAAFRVSPDGNYISYLAPYENRMNIHVMKRGDKEAKRLTSIRDRDLRNYLWKGSNHLVFAKDSGGDENFHIWVTDREGKETKDLTPFEKTRVQIVNDLPDHDTDLLIGMNKRDPKVFDVYRLNVATGELKLVAENPGNISSWMTDHTGKLRVAVRADGVNAAILHRATESEPFKQVLETNFKEAVEPLFFTFDNKNLFVSSNRRGDKREIAILDLATGKEGETIYKRDDVDAEGLAYSQKRKVLTAATYTTWKGDRHFLDAATKAMYEDIQSKLKGYEIRMNTGHRDEQIWIVSAFNDRSRGVQYLYDAKTKELTKLAELAPWLKEADMAEMKPVEYKSRDGLTIHGYLTVPKGKDPKNLPVIVNPHGGPWARDDWGFDPQVQFLANRGYAVFQPNFRGSTGYGRKFWEASFRQWGKTMQNDITDGVQWLVKQGIANPKKICIYGVSYGGYATLAGMTFTPDLYACGVDYVGPSNLITLQKAIPPYWKHMTDMLHEMIGHPEKDKAQLEAVSPAFHADKIKAPLLVLQGAKDPRVPKAESDQMITALKARGVEAEYIVKDNEGHGFRNEENRFEAYEAMERFFGKHLN